MSKQAVTITYYTDPYCTWCWGSEPILRHIKEVYGDQVKISYKMGGLVKDMDDFYDPQNKISKMEQVAPHWLDASNRHGMPVDESIFTDPKNDFSSTYPASIAYKAAEMQSKELAALFLRRIREATSCEHRFIHQEQVLIELAEAVGLDPERFVSDLNSAEAEEAFYSDLEEARSKDITGFPTFILRGDDGEEIIFYGYRPFHIFDTVLNKLSKEPLRFEQPTDILSFVKRWSRVTTQEVMEVFDLDRRPSLERLEELARKKKIRKKVVGNGELWEKSSVKE